MVQCHKIEFVWAQYGTASQIEFVWAQYGTVSQIEFAWTRCGTVPQKAHLEESEKYGLMRLGCERFVEFASGFMQKGLVGFDAVWSMLCHIQPDNSCSKESFMRSYSLPTYV